MKPESNDSLADRVFETGHRLQRLLKPDEVKGQARKAIADFRNALEEFNSRNHALMFESVVNASELSEQEIQSQCSGAYTAWAMRRSDRALFRLFGVGFFAELRGREEEFDGLEYAVFRVHNDNDLERLVDAIKQVRPDARCEPFGYVPIIDAF